MQELIDQAVYGCPMKTLLSAFTGTLTTSLTSLHLFDSLYWVLTKVAEPVQTAWVTHDRGHADKINKDFYKAMVTANEHYLRYALATTGPKDVKDLARGITKLGVDVLAACTVTKSLDW